MTQIRRASPESIADAARLLQQGRLVAFPTETVYGLGGDAGNDRAVAAIFAAKDRPQFNPLIAHVADLAAAEACALFDGRARALCDALWPGPLTVVLPRRPEAPISLLASAGLDTVALRAPDHEVAQALLRAAGRPIAAPSANRSGAVSPTRAEHVIESLGERVELVIDGGPCRVGIESTILDLSGETPTLLRPGGVARERLEQLLGQAVAVAATGDAVKAPGQLASHYAPGLAVRLDVTAPHPGEAVLGFGDCPEATLNLSFNGDLEEAAANLFAMLRALDRPPFAGIAVCPVPGHGLGAAINDRLRRAAAPRENRP